MASTITIDGIRKVFGSGAGQAVAVDGISLSIAAGELFFLLGPSGCGKTTLLRMIAGFIEPSAGRVLFDGRDVTALPPNRRNAGMVFQSYALWPHMTVESNVEFGLDIRRVPAAERHRRVAEALDVVRMREHAKRRPNQLSGGQQQRVALARALVVRPDVLLLDEPLSNLDAKLRTELRAEIRRICKSSGHGGGSITTIYVTHDQKEALSMADRIAIIDRGRVVQVGGPEALYRRPANRFVAEFLGETNFLDGTLVESAGGSALIETPIGRLASTANTMAQRAVGSQVLCSLRPEAIRLTGGAESAMTNRMTGRVISTTYLGELAQVVIDVNGVQLKTAVLNPRLESITDSQAERAVAIDASDVVVLPFHT